jgi:hypothetical protein
LGSKYEKGQAIMAIKQGMATVFFALVFILFSLPARAEGPGTSSANFLKIAQGARPVAMGETYIALGQGLDTLTWNPAGLSQLDLPTALFVHGFLYEGVNSEFVSYGMPLGPLGVIAGGVTLVHVGAVQETLEDATGNYAGTGGTLYPLNFGFTAGYGQRLDHFLPATNAFLKNILMGANLRFSLEDLNQSSVVGGALDLGAIWRQTAKSHSNALANSKAPGFEPVFASEEKDEGLRAGFLLQNLGASSDQVLPINFRVGAAYIARNLISPQGAVTVAMDLVAPLDNSLKVSLGLEYAHETEHAYFAGRLGYKIGNEIADLDPFAGFTAGAGAAMILGGLKYQLDYAFVPYGQLGFTHRVALSLGFLAKEQTTAAGRILPAHAKSGIANQPAGAVESEGQAAAHAALGTPKTPAAGQPTGAAGASTEESTIQGSAADNVLELEPQTAAPVIAPTPEPAKKQLKKTKKKTKP